MRIYNEVKKFLICIIISGLCLATQSFAIIVEFKDEQINNSSMLALRMRVVNESSVTHKNVKLRYIFSYNVDKQVVLDSGYTAGAHVTLQMVNDSLGYIEISIDSINQGYFPNSSGFYQGLHYSDWSEIGKQSHPSYKGKYSFVENENILVYEHGSLIYGNENILPKPRLKLKIIGFQPEGNAWLEIKNFEKDKISLENITITGKDSVEHALGFVSLDSMGILRICKNDSACYGADNKIILPDFAWGRIGEALLKKDSILLSYVPWGDEGEFAEKAVAAGIWKNVEDFFPSSMWVEFYPVEYKKMYSFVYVKIRAENKLMIGLALQIETSLFRIKKFHYQ